MSAVNWPATAVLFGTPAALGALVSKNRAKGAALGFGLGVIAFVALAAAAGNR